MSLRHAAIALGLLVAGCTKPLGYCESDGDCPAFAVCYVRYQVCVQREQVPDGGQPFEVPDAAVPIVDAGSVVMDAGASDAGVSDAGVADAGSRSTLPCDGGYCGRWVDAGMMASERRGHRAVLLQDGRVLVTGGSFDRTAEIFDPSTGSWSRTGDLQMIPMSDHVALLLHDGRVLACGGQGGQGVRPTCEIFQPKTLQWSPAAPMLYRRVNAAAVVLPDGRPIVIGGYGDRCLSEAEVFTPQTGIWSSVPSMLKARSGHAAVLMTSGRVVVLGGVDCNADPNVVPTEVEAFDPGTSSWRMMGPLTTGRPSVTATVLDGGDIIVVSNTDRETDFYSAGDGLWLSGGRIGDARMGHTASLLRGGSVLVVGGATDKLPYLASVESFERSSRLWRQVPPMRLPRRLHAATVLLDGRVLVTGGYSQSPGTLRDAEIFE